MRLKMTLLVAAAGVLLTTGYAIAENTQQNKMKTCNAEAKTKDLKGDARKAFMKTCLSAGGETAAKPLTAQQEKMKSCNADAAAKKLKGADRQAFMKTCLSAGKSTAPLSPEKLRPIPQ